jgi:hypothetical protein
MQLNEDTLFSYDRDFQLRELCTHQPALTDAAEQIASEQKYKFRMVNSQSRRRATSLLVEERYAWRGYTVEGNGSTAEPSMITVAADCGGNTVATITLYFDSQRGLPADQNFSPELDALRARGAKLVEPSRLAIGIDVPRRVFASMMHIAHICVYRLHGATDMVIEVNPRHVTFYKKMLGFHSLADERQCSRVNAPAVLLQLECQSMEEKIRRQGGCIERHIKEKSFYPYFFSPNDESVIAKRLALGRA